MSADFDDDAEELRIATSKRNHIEIMCVETSDRQQVMQSNDLTQLTMTMTMTMK